MHTDLKQQRYHSFLQRKYQRLLEESYNVKYTDHSLSDVLAFEALRLHQKMEFLRFQS